MSTMKMIQVVPSFEMTPAEIQEKTNSAIAACRKIYDEVAKVPTEEATFERVVEPLMVLDTQYSIQMEIVTFLQYVSLNEEVRDASRVAEKQWSDFHIEMATRKDHYNLFLEVQKKQESSLTGDQARLLKHSMRGYRRLGLGLPDEEREELKRMLNREKELAIKFDKNIADDKSHVFATSSQLDGLDEGYLKRTSLGGDKLEVHKITAKYPDVFPVLQFCHVDETRKRVVEMFESRAYEDNIGILQELLALRQQRAQLLGYENNVEFQTEILMAKDAKTVRTFLEEVLEKLSGLTQEYVKTLNQMKLATGKKDGLQYWDYSYYHQKYLQQNHQIDHQKIKEYFPSDYVLDRMLEIYAEIFNLEFKETTLPEGSWFPSLRYFEVRDGSNREMMLGSFYLDLYPREGKFTHAAAWGLVHGHLNEHGEQVLPLEALVCNFNPAVGDQPSLLTFDEVNTLFHEFGHVIHGICGGYLQRYYNLSGTSVERDFVETPSQMIENWMWEPVILRRITQHYQSGEPLSEDLISKLVGSRHVGAARDWTRQATLSLVDHTLHLSGHWKSSEEITKTFKEISDRYMGYPCGNGKSLGNWGHLAGGYDARYYGYTWSRVISSDLYSRFSESGNPLDQKVGMDYRRKILEPGGSQDGLDLVRNYLGRDTSIEPFLAMMRPRSEKI